MINFKTGTDKEPAVLEMEGNTLAIFNELCAMAGAVCEKIADETGTPYEIVVKALNITLEKGAKNEKGNSSKGH